MGKIINIQEFSEERYQRTIEREAALLKQSQCHHKKAEVDGEIDEVICLDCNKKFNSFEYLNFIAENETGMQLTSFNIENKKHYLQQEVLKLEEKITELKREKRALTTFVNKHS